MITSVDSELLGDRSHLVVVGHHAVLKLNVDIFESWFQSGDQYWEFSLHVVSVAELNVSLVSNHIIDVVGAVLIIVNVVLEPLILWLLLRESLICLCIPIQGNSLHGGHTNSKNSELHFYFLFIN